MSIKDLLKEQQGEIDSWFEAIADKLLNHVVLNANSISHRICELEYYYITEPHNDVFTHNDPLQKECGKWYFHRTKGTYRDGSFKGLDITFGKEGIPGGILIRSIEPIGSDMIVGPSLSVDHLLRVTESNKIVDLDTRINSKEVWDTESPLYIHEEKLEEREVYTSPRVGLSLKKAYLAKKMSPYIMKPYRYLTCPKIIKKGRPHVALGLYIKGKNAEEIHELTNIPKRSVEKYITNFESGKNIQGFSEYIGKNINTETFARLYGTWHKEYQS